MRFLSLLVNPLKQIPQLMNKAAAASLLVASEA